MTPPKEENDPVENALRNSETEDSNACTAEKELSLADTNTNSQIDNSLSIRDLSSSSSHEDTDPQAAKNCKHEEEKTQIDPPHEELIGNSPPFQIPIPRKLIIPRLRLFRIIYLSIPILQIDEKKPLADKIVFYPGKVEMKISNYCHNTIYAKMLLQRLQSRRVPFFNNYEINRMIIQLFCRRHFSHPAGPQNNMRVKQKYTAVLQSNAPINDDERNLFGRPLRAYYYHPLTERMALGNSYKSNQKKDGNNIFVRPMLHILQAKIQNVVHRNTSENYLKTRHKLRLVIVTSNKSWKYFCVICGCAFDSFSDFKQHSCRIIGN
ncbi:CPX chromosomal region candidate gene 1 protein [Nannospalax galili]|uniref:CPX chromosomal region candidate gene 1 protein n=1 Tax=Nannospalax galili TaxID=1026970 RepID=UPI0004ED2041|nr:CPX chromosomal region candidate gene 1 protein [Nannospalax galili]